MKFYVTVDLKGLPKSVYKSNVVRGFDAEDEFGRLLADQGDLLVVAGYYDISTAFCVYHRGGDVYRDELGRRYPLPDETIVLVFDDFVPGFTKDSRPEWYDLLWERILSVKAEAEYGPDQLIQVTEEIKYCCAVAKVRHVLVQCSHQRHLCYHVKISAEGSLALACAMALHQLILAGGTE